LKVKFFEWASTFFIIGGAILLSYNLEDMSAISYFIGSLGWCVTSILWKKWSLFVTNFVISLIFISGWLFQFYGGL